MSLDLVNIASTLNVGWYVVLRRGSFFSAKTVFLQSNEIEQASEAILTHELSFVILIDKFLPKLSRLGYVAFPYAALFPPPLFYLIAWVVVGVLSFPFKIIPALND